jgi:hypothetical protein
VAFLLFRKFFSALITAVIGSDGVMLLDSRSTSPPASGRVGEIGRPG